MRYILSSSDIKVIPMNKAFFVYNKAVHTLRMVFVPLGRPRRRWVDNIRMDLGEVGWDDVDWIGLAQDRNRRKALVNSVLNLWVT
jgi:hypothetical protein